MEALQTKMREEAARLLSQGLADVVVGYEAGSLPLTAQPAFVTSADDVGRLILNPLCGLNLAKFVHDLITQHREAQKRQKPEARTRKVVAVVAPGCATRSLTLHLNERQYERGDVVILGVPCEGVVDARRLKQRLGVEELPEGTVSGSVIKAAGQEIPVSEVLAESCVTCRFNNPVLSDVALGPDAPAKKLDAEYDEVLAFEALAADERWKFFLAEMAKCMRCNACRNVCPSCYCRSCFVEQTGPQWVGIGQDEHDVQIFQLMRLYHMAGRCVDCGACSAVCPNGVDLHKFLKKMEKDAVDLFGQRVAVSVEDAAPLATARDDDPEEFIFNP